MDIEFYPRHIGVRIQPDTNFTSITERSLNARISIVTGAHTATGLRETLLYKFDKQAYSQQSALQWVLYRTYTPLPQYYAPSGNNNELLSIQNGRYVGVEGVSVDDNGLAVSQITSDDDLTLKTANQKTTVFDPAVYDDLPPASLLSTRVGVSAPDLTTFVGNIKQYTFGVNAIVHGTSEIVHTYKQGEDLDIHLHWVTNGLDATDRAVKFEIEVSIANGNTAFPTSTVYSEEIVIPSDTPDRTHLISEFGFPDGESLEIGAYIVFSFKRVAASGTDPSNDPFALAVGFHAPNDTAGSRQRFVK